MEETPKKEPQSEPEKPKRFWGIYVIAVIVFIPAIIFSSAITYYHFLYVAMIVGSIVLSYGIFMLRNWARVCCIWLTAFGWLYFLLVDTKTGTIKPFHSIIEQAIIFFIPAGIIIYYLMNPRLKQQIK